MFDATGTAGALEEPSGEGMDDAPKLLPEVFTGICIPVEFVLPA
jgi:hypothetical protein